MSIKSDKGFTLLELMIAVVIFGILMMIASQFLRGEIRMYNSASRQDAIEQKARTAMVHLLDEVRLNRYVTYYSGDEGSGYNKGIYTKEPDQAMRCLINVLPRPEVLNGNLNQLPNGTEIYYDYIAKKLWYRDSETNNVHLIADEIESVEIQNVTEHLLQIYLQVKSATRTEEQELLTWIRMY